MQNTHQLDAPAMSYANWLAYCAACSIASEGAPMTGVALTVELLIAEHAVRAGIVFG